MYVAFFTIWAKLTVAFTCTNLLLNFHTSVSGCGCGFGFEQKFWRIDGFGEKRHGSADLHTPIHPSFLETAVKAQVLTMVDSSKFAVNQFSLRAQCRLR